MVGLDVRSTVRARRRRAPRLVGAVLGAVTAGLWLVASVAAHGIAPSEAPSAASILFGWTFPPLPTLGILAITVWWIWAVRRVNTVHPTNRAPPQRSVAFLAGMLALAFAVASGIE